MRMEDGRTFSGAEFLAETLRSYGTTHVFYVEAILRRALVEMEALGIQRIVAHSEKAAAYMADGFARVSHRPGICMAQSVGAANLAAGLQDAYLGLSPVVAITGQRPPLARHRNAYQEILHGSMFDPVTKYNVEAVMVEQLPFYLRQAFRDATSGAPRPVHIDVIGNLGEEIEAAEGRLDIVAEDTFTRYPAFRPEPNLENVRAAVRAIEAAERPVIIAGGGVQISSAGREVVELAERLLAPVATSLNGKGTIPDNHPLCVGVVGSYSRKCANQVVSEADLIIYVGSHTGDQVTNGWTIPDPSTRVVQVDIDPSELGRNYPCTVPVMGDAKVAVKSLLQALGPATVSGRWAARAQGLVQSWLDEVAPLRQADATPIRPERLCHELGQLLPADAVLVADTGYSAYWTGNLVDLTSPGQRYLRAAGSLGWAFPASLGAKCAAPDRPVVCFIGDGGLWYHLAELETACRCGISTVTIVNNNSGYGQCRTGVNRAYGGRAGSQEAMYRFRDMDFAKFAQDIGCLGIRVEHPGGIGPAISKALQADVPAVVDVVTDITCCPPRPWPPS